MLHHYIKSFFILIRKNRFFYVINLFGFITGFLLLTIIFTFGYQEVSYDRFNTNAYKIYRINSGGYGVTPMCFGEQLKGQLPEIEQVVRFHSVDFTPMINNRELPIEKCYYTDPGVFQLFSFKLLSGENTNVLNRPFTIVLDQSTSKKLFGNRSPVGETIQDKNDNVYTVTGVMEDMPNLSHFKAHAFVSMETLHQVGTESDFNCGSWFILTYVSLADGANKTETEAKLNVLLKDSRMGPVDGKIPLKLESLKKLYFDAANNKYDGSKHGNRQTLLLYFAISIFTLLIVIINYINLSTAIAANRMKEFAIRKVNGATRAQIIRQNILETLGLIIVSYMLALLLVELFLPQISRILNISIDASIHRAQFYFVLFLFLLIIAFITGLIPGLFLSGVKETKALKNESIFRTKGLQRKLLLGFQLVTVAILLNSVFIIQKQLNYVLNKDLGFNTENIVVARLNQKTLAKNEVIKNALLQNPQIKMVSFSDGITGDGFTKKPINFNEEDQLCYFYTVDPDYAKLYDLKLKYGRNFSWDRPTDFDKGCMVNEEFCKVFNSENPVNRSFHGMTIVGVVKDFNYSSLHKKTEPLILACGNSNRALQIEISNQNQKETVDFVHNTLAGLSSDSELELSFMNDHLKDLYQAEINLKQSFQIYTLIILLISVIGLFGLTLFTIKKKTKETGIRKLHGASITDTFMLLSKEQIIIVAVANVMAVPFSVWIMHNWLANFDYKVSIGSGVFLGTFLVSLAFNLLAISLLLYKTHRTNPAEVLKYE